MRRDQRRALFPSSAETPETLAAHAICELTSLQ